MSDYDNQVGLWKRQPKKNEQGEIIDDPNKKYPNYTGNAMVNGTNYDAAAWLGINKTNPKQPDINIKLSIPKPKNNDEEQTF